MPKLIEIPVYTFAELSDKAKDKAHYDFLACGSDSLDTDCTVQYWKDKLEMAGFNIDQFGYSVGGYGDHVSITGGYRYRKGWKKAYIAEHGNQCKILPHLLELQYIQAKYLYDFDLDLSVSNYGTQRLEYDFLCYVFNDRYKVLPDAVQKDLLSCILNINAQILADLRSDYDWVCSVEYFEETCECNEWMFLESGEIYHG